MQGEKGHNSAQWYQGHSPYSAKGASSANSHERGKQQPQFCVKSWQMEWIFWREVGVSHKCGDGICTAPDSFWLYYMFSVQRQFHIEEIVDTKHRELPMKKKMGVKQCLVVGNGSWVTRLGTECKVHTYANDSHLLFLWGWGFGPKCLWLSRQISVYCEKWTKEWEDLDRALI